MSKTITYTSWVGMKSRCLRTSDPYYKIYGGRGITVDPEWMDFVAFVRDMGLRPSRPHSIDRIDSNGGYSKLNCRWALPEEQGNNRRDNHYLTYQGERLTIAQWSRKLGINQITMEARARRGLSVDRILHVGSIGSAHPITHDGETHLLSEWASKLNIKEITLASRLRHGWPIEKALSVENFGNGRNDGRRLRPNGRKEPCAK